MKVELYPGKRWIAAELINRENRFVMALLYKGEVIKAHVPNTGRMEEFLFPGSRFFLIPSEGKYKWRVVGTEYGGYPVLLDTIKMNRVAQLILEKGFLGKPGEIRREVKGGNSKFDFRIDSPDYGEFLEVKSCNLCHEGVAMFPDAPTTRGLRHIRELDYFKSTCMFITTHFGAEVFMPNHHTDPEYSKTLTELENIRLLAGKIRMEDPLNIDISSFSFLEINLEQTRIDCGDWGTYLLVLEALEGFSVKTGALGIKHYPAGYYIYTGSALKNLKKRVKRHGARRKKTHWHIDYILPAGMKLIKTYVIRRKDRLEEMVGRDMLEIADDCIDGFGATDSPLKSHLTYFKEKPVFQKQFQEILLNYRMYIK